jgi:FdhD protein
MSSTAVGAAVRSFNVLRSGEPAPRPDDVAVELPLQVCLDGEPFSVIMRTPGADRELALGFLFTEGLVRRRDDIERITVDEPSGLVDVVLGGARRAIVAEALGRRRAVTMNSSCGLCGRQSLAAVTVSGDPCRVEWAVGGPVVAGLPDALRRAQSAFARTGGLHAAGLFDPNGTVEASAEDVGRHNAVDKLLGGMLEAGRLPLDRSLLVVSGRASFEIVQKAWLGGIPFVAAVSAPSSLAIELAREAGVTLLGFVREGRFNVYAHPERLSGGPGAGA